MQFEHPDRKYGYTIETSPDDRVYALKDAAGTHTPWPSFFEFSIIGI